MNMFIFIILATTTVATAVTTTTNKTNDTSVIITSTDIQEEFGCLLEKDLEYNHSYSFLATMIVLICLVVKRNDKQDVAKPKKEEPQIREKKTHESSSSQEKKGDYTLASFKVERDDAKDVAKFLRCAKDYLQTWLKNPGDSRLSTIINVSDFPNPKNHKDTLVVVVLSGVYFSVLWENSGEEHYSALVSCRWLPMISGHPVTNDLEFDKVIKGVGTVLQVCKPREPVVKQKLDEKAKNQETKQSPEYQQKMEAIAVLKNEYRKQIAVCREEYREQIAVLKDKYEKQVIKLENRECSGCSGRDNH
jgi:hypothetical protein